LPASGGATSLNAVAQIREQQSPLAITHVGQFPAATVNFDTAPGVSLGTATEAIRAAIDKLQLAPGVSTTFLGSAGAFGSSLNNQLWLILAALVCVYIVLGVLYESFIHPLTILSTLPSAGVGALFAAIPLMLGMGMGAELRRPLGIAIFGGLIVSQLLTVFTTPIVYLYFDRGQRWFARRGWGVPAKHVEAAEAPAPAPPVADA